MTIPSPKGVYDILPLGLDENELWRRSDLWQYVEAVASQLALLYGYREIRTPIFERTELFQRGVGESSDIVSKEMYTFPDKAGRSMTLRPELTASAMRAFIENKLHQCAPMHKLFYMGPMFRYDRPQAGRYRQFSQIGIEAIGSHSPQLDVEVIDMLYTFYQQLGMKNLTLHLNSVGDAASRDGYKKALKEFLRPHFEKLSEDSKVRFELNPLRILDSKDETDQKILLSSPSIHDFLNETSQKHLDQVCHLLDTIQIPYFLNHKLVRGLDYYNQTVFEITAGELGAQNTIGAGGRYDGLIHSLGGPDLPAVGWATGIERIIQTMLAQKVEFPKPPSPTLFLIGIGELAKEKCFLLLKDLRSKGISVEMDFSSKKLKDVLRYAGDLHAKYSLVIGDHELQSNTAELKDMESRTSTTVALSEVAATLTFE